MSENIAEWEYRPADAAHKPTRMVGALWHNGCYVPRLGDVHAAEMADVLSAAALMREPDFTRDRSTRLEHATPEPFDPFRIEAPPTYPGAARGEGFGSPPIPSWHIFFVNEYRSPRRVELGYATLQHGDHGVTVRYLSGGGSTFYPYSAIESIEYTP